MNFIDEVFIDVSAGDGGDGCLSFRREKNLPKGGPNGGDGGQGGNVILKASQNINTLERFRNKKEYSAKSGSKGLSRNKTGSNGDDLVLEIPCGTTVYDINLKEEIIDLEDPSQEVVVVKGGKGGKGNSGFKSSTNRSPTRITKGQKGERRFLRLELKVLADVGLLGKPNAGKSSLVNSVSSATPRIADYEFTTLSPKLGVVNYSSYSSFVISDIPGLISGASKGVGLGLQFLKHLSRTRVILQLVDISNKKLKKIIEELNELVNEIKEFDEKLAERERWIILNKIDLISNEQRKLLETKLKSCFPEETKIYFISALQKLGTEILMKDLGFYLETLNEKE